MIIFINGTINAGKTTVAKLLAAKIPNSALVEIDAFRAMIEWMPLEQAIPLNLENAVSVIKNFSKQGIHVIVPYPLSQKNYEYVVKELEPLEIKVFTLAPSLESALSNRGSRELDEKEKDRIKRQYEMGIHTPSFGEIIDNSNTTPEQTAEIILNKLSV